MRKRPVDTKCTPSLIEYAWYFLVIDMAFELLELVNHAYMANRDWEILREPIVQKIFVSMVVVVHAPIHRVGGLFADSAALGAALDFSETVAERAATRARAAEASLEVHLTSRHS